MNRVILTVSKQTDSGEIGNGTIQYSVGCW